MRRRKAPVFKQRRKLNLSNGVMILLSAFGHVLQLLFMTDKCTYRAKITNPNLVHGFLCASTIRQQLVAAAIAFFPTATTTTTTSAILNVPAVSITLDLGLSTLLDCLPAANTMPNMTAEWKDTATVALWDTALPTSPCLPSLALVTNVKKK